MLPYSEFPDEHDPHRCGSAPFVPVVDAPRQHSCGSYPASFDQNGCSRWLPNYPDDLWLAKHGCKGLGDCNNGQPPQVDLLCEGGATSGEPACTPEPWPATGYRVPPSVGSGCGPRGCPQQTEGFSASGRPHRIEGFSASGGLDVWTVLFVIIVFWFCARRLK